MPKTVTIHAARMQLSRLVDEAAAGEEIVIARAGRPVARLIALAATRKRRRPGSMKGRIRVRKDFDAPLPPAIADALGDER